MSKHTPGPWRHHDAAYQNNDEPAFTVGPQEFHTVALVRAGNTDDDLPAQTEANARLIAAAPDLLTALKGLLAIQWQHPETVLSSAACAAARAAIANAEGRV